MQLKAAQNYNILHHRELQQTDAPPAFNAMVIAHLGGAFFKIVCGSYVENGL
jgi:hypothetical protein